MFLDFSKLSRLPSIPAVAVRLLERFADPEVSIIEIAGIIHSDPAITAKILRAASSSQFGASRAVPDLDRAVNLLGRKTVTSLALCFSLSDDSMRSDPFSNLYKGVWLQSILQAIACQLIARRFDRAAEGEYFTTGLLAEIGRLALLKATPQEYANAIERQLAGGGDDRPPDLANSADGLTIALLKHWNLSERFSDAVQDRHLDAERLRSIPEGSSRRLTHALALASAISSYFVEPRKALALVRVHDLASSLYTFSEEQTTEFLDAVQTSTIDNAEIFDTDISRLGSPAEIMSDAMEQLSHIATSSNGELSDPRHRDLLDENGKLKQRVRDLLRRNMLDGLTGIFNREHIDQAIAVRITAASLAMQAVGLLFIDADHFKKVNDTYGHAAGDVALKRIAETLGRLTRGDDLVARYGGEEFVVLAADPTPQALSMLAERLRAAVERERLTLPQGAFGVTISIGGAIIQPPHNESSAANLVREADAALYQAKARGRNCVEIHLPAA